MPQSFAARRLPRHAGPAAWSDLLGQRPDPVQLTGTRTADFAVVGAGFAGLSAARRLLQLNPGARVAVLDAGRVAEGAAGRNSGFMIDLPHDLASETYAGAAQDNDRRMIALNRQAIAFAKAAVEDYGIDPNYFDPAGKTNAGATETSVAHTQSYARHLDALGEPYELLDAPAMRDLTGSRYYRAGLYTPGTVMLQPAGYVRGLAAGLSRVAEIYEQSPVTGIIRDGTAWVLQTPHGRVRSEKVVLANNGQIESFGFAAGRLLHVFLFACMTEELDGRALRALGGHSRWGVTPADPMGTTVRRIDAGQGGNRIVVRSCAAFEPGMQSSSSDMGRAARVMRAKFDARFPQLSDVALSQVWSGHLCLSRNGVSVTGEVADNLFAACCQNGLGTARGTLTGIAAAERSSGVSSDITAFFAAQEPPQKLPPAIIAKAGATAVLRWKEWRARRE